MNLSDLMTTAASRHGDRTAIRQDGVSLSYTALERATGLVAGLLRERNGQPGDRVGVMLPNVVYFPICYYGALRGRRDRADEHAAQGARGGVLHGRLGRPRFVRMAHLRGRGRGRGSRRRGDRRRAGLLRCAAGRV